MVQFGCSNVHVQRAGSASLGQSGFTFIGVGHDGSNAAYEIVEAGSELGFVIPACQHEVVSGGQGKVETKKHSITMGKATKLQTS